jgi:hypothetical protein
MTSADATPPLDEDRKPSPAWLAVCRRVVARLLALARPRRHTPAAEAEVWARRLAEEEGYIRSVISGMELEFLETGEGLDRLARQLTQIQQLCQKLSDLTLGQSEDAAVRFAFQLLKKSEDLVLASYDQYDHVFATFSELQQRLAQLARQHDDLMRVLLPLNFITLAFRIEAGRHPVEIQQAFSTLATSVNRTVTEVRATMEKQFEDIAVSERIARCLVERIADTIQHHRRDVTATLESSRQQLRTLAGMLDHCQAGAADLARLNQAVNHHIGGMVMAQQCQDITRQKIEHVGEAMIEMRTHLEDPRAADARQFVFQAGQIQLQQVQGVFNQLNDAALSLKTGISGLHSEAGAAAEAVVKVGATTLEAGVSKLCQAGISEILHRVQESVHKFADILEAFKPLQASFVDCTGKATTLAGDVRHAGLNAQVFAIHAPEGATLEVLAGRVRFISEDVIQHVEEMRTALNHTAAMINNLRGRLEDFQLLAQAEEEVLNAESAISQQKLAELETAIPALIEEVTRQQAAFANDVKHALAHVRFPDTVVEASTRSLRFFKDLVAWSGATGRGPDPTSATSRKLDQLKSNYTMAAERDVHAATLQAVPVTKPANAAPTGAELFGDLDPIPTTAAASPSAMPETLPTPVSVPLAEPPAPPGGLGDNVELF